MKMLSQISMVILCLSTSASTWARTWTNAEGKAIEADFVKLENGVAHLKKGGKVYKVPLDKLSKGDQEFIAEQERAEEKPAVKLPITLTTKISGDDLKESEISGKPIVIHQWQAHCGACPAALEAYEKLARRNKKSGATFMIWHSVDKLEMAQKKSKSLKLKLPVYHGGMIGWDKKFGKFVWPHVVLLDVEGKVAYMGKPDKKFQKMLKDMKR